MKKYRVTNLHPILKEGSILTYGEPTYGVPTCSLTTVDGQPCPIVFMSDLRVESHPTWYEEVKPERWEPTLRETIFEIDCHGNIVCDAWTGQPHEWMSYEKGLVFRSQGQAEEAAKRVRACLLAYQEEITK